MNNANNTDRRTVTVSFTAGSVPDHTLEIIRAEARERGQFHDGYARKYVSIDNVKANRYVARAGALEACAMVITNVVGRGLEVHYVRVENFDGSEIWHACGKWEA